MPTTEYFAGIGCGTGRQLLNAVRYTSAYLPAPGTGVAWLNSQFRPRSASPPGPTYISALDAHLSQSSSSALQRGDFIEIQGPSGSGKTAVLNFLAMTSILPVALEITVSSNVQGGGFVQEGTSSALYTAKPKDDSSRPFVTVPLGGKDQQVVYIHSATVASPLLAIGKTARTHIIHCIERILTATTSLTPDLTSPQSPYGPIIEAAVQGALRNLSIFTLPISSNPTASLAATLSFIPVYQREHCDKEIQLVLVDGAGDGFWQQRWTSEQQRSARVVREGLAIPEGIRGSMDVGMHDVMRAITNLRRDLGIVVVTTVQGLWRTRAVDRETRYWESHLPQPYPKPFVVDLRSSHESASTAMPAENRRPALMDPYWPLTAHITLSAPCGHPLIGNSNSVGQFRPETKLIEALTSEGHKREQARTEARWSGFCRTVGPGGTGVAGDVGVFDFRMSEAGLRP